MPRWWGRRRIGEGSSAHGIGWSFPGSGYCPLQVLVHCSSSLSLTVAILLLSWHSWAAFPKTSVPLWMHVYRLYSTSWPQSDKPRLSWWEQPVQKGVFGSSSSVGQDTWEGSGSKAMCLSKLGKFVASWMSLRPNVSGYILSVAAGSWRVVFSAQVPGLISVYCWLDRHVSNLWGSALVLGSWCHSTQGNAFFFFLTVWDWVFFSYLIQSSMTRNNPAFQHRCFCFFLLTSLAHQEPIDQML